MVEFISSEPKKQSDRVISTCYKTVKVYYPNVPFSQLDKDSHVEKKYSDGRKTLDVYSKSRYSEYINRFNEVAKEFGYKFDEYKERGVLDGYFVFKNEDSRLPVIYLTTGFQGSDSSYLIKMAGGEPHLKIMECNATLKTHQDCFNLLYKKLYYAYKFSKFDDIRKKLALLNIKNKLKNK